MSAAERPEEPTPADDRGQPHPDASQRLARRRDTRRRRHLVRVDLGLGVVGAVVLLLATPGLAITGLVALIVLVLCLVTFFAERRGWSPGDRWRRRRARER
jgi:Flp pilus assembly protein TadB